MKRPTFYTALICIFLLYSCSRIEEFEEFVEDSIQTEQSDDQNGDSDNDDPNNQNDDSGMTGFAMTADINGTAFAANNPFGNNAFSETNIYTRYPIEDFVLLQGREGGMFGAKEINIWLKREDIAVGSYEVSYESLGLTPPTHYIEYTDSTNSIFEQTLEGTVTIVEVNATEKTVSGTFEFTTVNDDEFAPVDFTITEGEFNYIFE